jgi:hypothetical protein
MNQLPPHVLPPSQCDHRRVDVFGEMPSSRASMRAEGNAHSRLQRAGEDVLAELPVEPYLQRHVPVLGSGEQVDARGHAAELGHGGYCTHAFGVRRQSPPLSYSVATALERANSKAEAIASALQITSR